MQNWSQQIFQSLCDDAEGLNLLEEGHNLGEADENDHLEPRHVDDQVLNVLHVHNSCIYKFPQHKGVDDLAHGFN